MLKKKYAMNLTNVVALGIGSIVGAGIFALLGQVVFLAGKDVYYAFLISGTAALFSGYSYAKLAGAYPDSGGLTDYFHIAFPIKWISGGLTLIYVLTSAISISMMAKSFGIYMADFFGYAPDSSQIVNACAVSLITVLVFLNMLGASDVGRTETLLVGIKLFILLSLIAAAFIKFSQALPQSPDIPSSMNFFQSVGITFFAYAGYGVITNAAADVPNPKRTIAWAIYLTLLIVMALYLGLAFVVLKFVPLEQLNLNADTAAASAARSLLGTWGYGAVYFAAVLSFITGISATFFSIFRISRSLAKQKTLPRFYIKKFWGFGTYGNLLTSSLIILATVYFDFNSIVNLSSGAYLVCYMGVFAAAWHLRRETKSSKLVILTGWGLMFFILIAFLISIS